MPTQRLRLASLLLVVLFPRSTGVQTPAPARILAEADRLAWLSNWQRAKPLYARAEQVSVQAGDQRDKLYAECGRLRAEMDAGSWAKISSELATVLGNPIVQNDRRLMLRCLATKGDVNREDDPEAARAAWEKALDLAKSLGDSGWQSRAEAELGIIDFMDGEQQQGRASMKDAMLSALFHFDRPTLVIYGAIICAGELEGGKADEALGYCDGALELAATIKDMGYPFDAYCAKARAFGQLGRHREAQQMLEAILAKTRELDMRLQESQTLIILGKESEAVGDLPQAIRYFEQAGDLSRANGFEHSIAWSMFEAAQAYRSVDDFEKAEDRETQAMHAMDRVGDRYHLPIHLALLADLKAKRREYREADQLYDRAADVVEAMLVGSPNDQVQTMIANTGDLYVGHFTLAATQLHDARKAYEVLEAARGRSIADALREQPPKQAPSDPILIAAKKNINQIQVALLRETDPPARRKLLYRLFEAEQILTPVGKPRTQLREATRHPHPVDLGRLQSSLGRDEMVLEYVLAEPQSFCLHVTRQTAAVSTLKAGRKQIEDLVESHLAEIRSMKSGANAAEKLYSILLQSIPGQSSKQRLIVVPDGMLNLLPFDSLQDSRRRYVLLSHVVTYAPSATVLYLLRTKPPAHQARMALLGIGGVDYEHNRPATATHNTAADRDPATLLRGVFDLSGDHLKNLPMSGDEVTTAARILGRRSTLLLGRDATEAAFKSQPLADFEILHLAVHGVANTKFPNRAALLLGVDPRGQEDGLLQTDEISELPLNADLVTLSACDTGVGKIEGEEGVAGLVQAFLFAGARAVVATLWGASDTYSAALMKHFYTHLAKGEDTGSALRQAKLDLLKQFGKDAAPSYWAGFTLVGDGSRAVLN